MRSVKTEAEVALLAALNVKTEGPLKVDPESYPWKSRGWSNPNILSEEFAQYEAERLGN